MRPFFLSLFMRKLLLILCISICNIAIAKEKESTPPIVYPTNWYKNMKDSVLQLIVNYDNVRDAKLNLKTDIVKVIKRYPCANPNYMMIDLLIPKDFVANYIPIEFEWSKKKKLLLNYPMLDRPKSQKKILQRNDLMYLIMPDRFANGDTRNDVNPSFNEKSLDKKEPFARHGGDLKGIENNINYFKELGVTTLWLTPFQENNEPSQSYHGYAITNHYLTDPRIGSNEQYKFLVNTLHVNQMKMVMDFVFNHIGDQHWMYKDMPFPNFIHRFDTFTRTNYRANTLMDPYASERDRKAFTNGWFDHHMPDLNLDDPALARYMIQNTLWWLMYADVDGIRIDTYSYPEYSFMQQWYKALRAEFPEMSVFGEIWEHAVPIQSYFTPKDKLYTEAMQNVLDFQFCFAMDEFVKQDYAWTEGIEKLYYVISQDYLYQDPWHHITFLDNHDLDRFLATVNGDQQKMKAALGILMTMRGIPCIFYGTELLMKGKGSHGIIREDMSGGWNGDAVNKFDSKNRSKEEQDMFNYIATIQAWRHSSDAFSEQAKMMQFIPVDGVYMFSRYSDKSSALIIYNSSKTNKKIAFERFEEIANQFKLGQDVITKKKYDLKNLELEPGSLLILDLMN
jgi:neopullulanase